MTALTATTQPPPVGKFSISPHMLSNVLLDFCGVCICMQFIEVSAQCRVEEEALVSV